MASATLWIGAIAAFWGIAYAINGATQAGAYVTVPVPLDAFIDPESAFAHPKQLPEGTSLQPSGNSVDLRAWDSTILEQLLSRGDTAVTGVALGLGAVLLRRLLLSILEGEPFRKGNPSRIARLAGLVVLSGFVANFLPQIAATMVLTRVGLSPSGIPTVHIPLLPIAAALLLLILAEAFRRGSELADDTAATI
ncbi:DUF2975 domain-containing protein [Nonomuraea sp. NPDC050404]|uniref:DUF2975 domain-containing protein n=1 Tax=Nonomuraea sp. NPDC050404 TaxID=3155783 RepID=UPI00340D5A6A